MTAPFLAFPVQLSGTGQLLTDDTDAHLRDLVLQVLLTEPGERLNQPEFGCGVGRLVFAGDSDVLRATTQFLVQQNLTRWLGDRLTVDSVEVETLPDEGRLDITVIYLAKATAARTEVTVSV